MKMFQQIGLSNILLEMVLDEQLGFDNDFTLSGLTVRKQRYDYL